MAISSFFSLVRVLSVFHPWLIFFLDIDSPIVDVPFQQQQQERGQGEPSPHFSGRSGLLTGGQALIADLDAGARLDVAFLRIEQVDGEAALAAVPLGLIDTNLIGRAERKGGFRLAVILAQGLAFVIGAGDVNTANGFIGPDGFHVNEGELLKHRPIVKGTLMATLRPRMVDSTRRFAERYDLS